MRLKPIDPKKYTKEQKNMAASMEAVLKTKLKGLIVHTGTASWLARST